MKKGVFILFALLLCNTLLVRGQFESQLSQYWAIPNFFNPGYAGHSNNIEISAHARLQWLGMDGAPKTTIVAAEMPWKFQDREHGLGAVVYNDRLGLFSRSVMSLQYAYKLKLGKGTLSIGLQGGYISESFHGGDSIKIPTDNSYHSGINMSIPDKLSANSIDVGLGLYYSTNKFYVGLSAMHLVAPTLELSEKYEDEVPRSYYLTAGYNIPLRNSLIELQPSLLIKAVEPRHIQLESDSVQWVNFENISKALWKQTQLDLSFRVTYKKMLWAGVSWRGTTVNNRESVVVMLGGKFNAFAIGYSFDYPMNPIGKSTWGSHELFLKYIVELDKKKKKSKEHKSVRIL